MDGFYIALDTSVGLLITGVFALAVLSDKEVRAARTLLIVAALLLAGRWIVWSYFTDSNWWVRALVGAAIGALLLGAVPALFSWVGLRGSLADAQSPLPTNEPTESQKNSVTISGSNNTVTIGHIGDVINQAAAPELKLSQAIRKQSEDGAFQTEIEAEVVAPYPTSTLFLEAWAPGISRFEASPERSGIFMFGNSGIRPDHAFTTVMNPFGRYKLVVITKTPEDVSIKYAFNQ